MQGIFFTLITMHPVFQWCSQNKTKTKQNRRQQQQKNKLNKKNPTPPLCNFKRSIWFFCSTANILVYPFFMILRSNFLRNMHFPGLLPKQLIVLTDVFLAVLSKNIMDANKCCVIDTNTGVNLMYKSRVPQRTAADLEDVADTSCVMHGNVKSVWLTSPG